MCAALLRFTLFLSGLVLVLSQGLPPLDSTDLVGSSSASGSLQALYGQSKAWRWAFKHKPAVACSSSARSLCAASDGEALNPALLALATSPSYYDARFPKYTGLTHGVIGSVRDQGSCFTCAAFASIAAAEAAICSALSINPSLLHLSQHSLAYCLNKDGFQRTCRSPWGIQQAISALAAALKVPRKITTAKCTPYILSTTVTSSTSTLEDTCRSKCTGTADDPAGYLNGQLNIAILGSAVEMQQHILAHGAAVTSMTLYDDFKAFFVANPKGVYPGPKKGAKVDQYHAVAVVGFDNDKNYWVAKNSWGKSFADGGFFRIAYGASAIASFGNMFGVTWQPVQPPAQQVDLLPMSTKPGCYSYTAKPTDFISRIANRFRLSVSNILLGNRNVITDLDKPIGGKVLTLCGLDPALTPAINEQQALLQLKAQVDRLGALDDWKVDARGVLALNSSQQPVHCGWTGVGCHPETGRVVAIAISDLSLGGALPSALTLQALPDLRGFYLYNAGLLGTLPPAYSGLKSLKQFALVDNFITGPLPALWTAGLKQLEVLNLARNQLTGTLPPEVSNIAGLQSVILTGNQFLGSIPATWAKFGNQLQLMDVSRNRLDGRLPTEIMALTNLQTFNASGNMLTGPLPDSWARMHSLGTLDLSSNNLNGTLPASWGSGMLGLTNVALADNRLRGTLPSSWNGLTRLQNIELQHNALTGQLPDSWSTLTKLQALQLSANALNGTLPASWGAWPGLSILDTSDNRLSGSLPKSYGNWGALYGGRFENNLLTGPLPSEWQNMRGVFLLFLGNNRLSGSLPAAWGNGMSRLNSLALSNNQLSGPLPPEWSRLQSLYLVVANNNQLSGTLPPSWAALKGLLVLILSGNKITGTLPVEIGGLPVLTALNLGCNRLTGTIPATYYTIYNLTLSNNKLTGTLPQQWGPAAQQGLTKLRVLDVSNNMLTGSVPSSWTSLKLGQLALYNNSGLTGCLPRTLGAILLSEYSGCSIGYNMLQGTTYTMTSSTTSSYQSTDRKQASQLEVQMLLGRLLSPQRQMSSAVMAASTLSSAPAANVRLYSSPTMAKVDTRTSETTFAAKAPKPTQSMVQPALQGTELTGLC